MTDDIPTSMAEAMAEIRRLRARIAELETGATRFAQAVFHQAMEMGTLAQPTPDEPATITRNVPPSAPPHDEQP